MGGSEEATTTGEEGIADMGEVVIQAEEGDIGGRNLPARQP